MSKIIQSNECPVCLEHYNEKCPPVALPCGHVTCSQCTKKVNNVCPECRVLFVQKATRRLFNAAEEKTETQQLNDFVKSFSDKTTKIKELEEANKTLNQKLIAETKKFSDKHKHDKKVINDLKAEIAAMKSKSEVYEKMWSKVGVAYFEAEKAIKNSMFSLLLRLIEQATFNVQFSGQTGKPQKFANSNKARLIYKEQPF